jgi:hypothetical protein
MTLLTETRYGTFQLSTSCCLATKIQVKNQSIKIADRSLENAAKFRYLGMIITNQNLIHEQIKSTLNSSNSCYQTVQNIFSSRLQSENIRIKLFETIILPIALCKFETCL